MHVFATHEVRNQVPPLNDYSFYDTDVVLREAAAREGAAAWEAEFREHAAWLGRAATLEAGDQANRHPPELQAYDAQGHRIDRVVFHPAWRFLMEGIVARGLHYRAWLDPAPGAHVARAAGYVMQGQVEAGTLCPATMTFAAFPLLRAEPEGELDLARDWLPHLCARSFDDADAPVSGKCGALVGMGLTEKQGGSDLRAISTRAEPVGPPGRGRGYLITGHKWFYSVPQADAHLVLALGESGTSCYFVPRWTPDGQRNAVRIRQLKDKLGNRSNASAEVEFEGAWGMQVGEPGAGVRLLLGMAATTRLDCVLGSAALLRQAVALAAHHASRRRAFGKTLSNQPLMRQLLADLALESEAATTLALRLARSADMASQAASRVLLRVGTPAAKLWICRRAVTAVSECLEVWGGNGYVESGPMARLYREAPVNAVWEGSSNIMALDVLRALRSEPAVLPALEAELDAARGAWADYDRILDEWRAKALRADEAQARHIAAGLARLWQAALLIRYAPKPVARAFVATRLAAAGGLHGEHPLDDESVSCILTRAWPGIC